jgi:hypothetical protein
MSPWKLLFWKQAGQLFIEFFNRLGQIQAPDGEVVFTCPLRRLPKVATIRATQCPANFHKTTER